MTPIELLWTWHPGPVTMTRSWSFPAPPVDTATLSLLGPLAPLASDPLVTDVFVTADGVVFADRGEGSVRVTGYHFAPDQAVALARSLIEAGGRHLDDASPIVDVRLAPGIRVHAALAPIALGGATISVRFSRSRHVDFLDLPVDWQHGQQQQLISAVHNRATFLITGNTGSGKTTLLASLLARSASRDRIVVLEDVAELDIDHPHVVQLECRQANVEGVGEIGLDRLVRESLRMRPTRLVVGECRGVELRELLAAFTSGHRGGASTIHAPQLASVPARMEALGVLAHYSPKQLARQVVHAFDLIIHISVGDEGRRQVELGRFVVGKNGTLAVEPDSSAEI
jgi:pilus assembly protein CpaF